MSELVRPNVGLCFDILKPEAVMLIRDLGYCWDIWSYFNMDLMRHQIVSESILSLFLCEKESISIYADTMTWHATSDHV